MPIIIIEKTYLQQFHRITLSLSLSLSLYLVHTSAHIQLYAATERKKKCRPRIKSFSPRSTHRGDSYTASSFGYFVFAGSNKLKLINLQPTEQMSGCVLVCTRLFYAHLIYITVRKTTPLKILSHCLVYTTRWYTNLTLAFTFFRRMRFVLTYGGA